MGYGYIWNGVEWWDAVEDGDAAAINSFRCRALN